MTVTRDFEGTCDGNNIG